MPPDNVIPIARRRRHPEAVPGPDAGLRRFRWFVAGLGVVWAAVLAAAIAFTPFPSIWPLLALSLLVVAAEHRFILFGDETSMSSSIVVILCAVSFWHDGAYLVGPMLVATCGGLLFQHLRSRSWAKILANGFGMALASAGGAFTLSAFLRITPGQDSALLGVFFCGMVYWLINNAVVARFVCEQTPASYFSSLKHLVCTDTAVVWYAVAASALVFARCTGPGLAIALSALIAVGNPEAMGHSECSLQARNRQYFTKFIGNTALIGAGFLVILEQNQVSWFSFGVISASAIAITMKGFGRRRPILNHVGFIVVLIAVLTSSIPLCVAIGTTACAICWTPRISWDARLAASWAAASVAVTSVANCIGATTSHVAIGALWSGAIGLALFVGSRLLISVCSVRKLGFLTFIGVAVPSRDEAAFATLVAISSFAFSLNFVLGLTAVIATAAFANWNGRQGLSCDLTGPSERSLS